MKPVDEKPSIYIAFNKENKKEDPKSEVGDHQRISKHKKFLQMVTPKVGLKMIL